MSEYEGYNRTSNFDSKYYKAVSQDALEKKWGPKKQVTDIQQQYYSEIPVDQHTDTNEYEAYAAQVEKKFHQERKKEWLKGYMKNYMWRHPKGMDLYKI